jgi:hypothetical protein
MFPHGIFIEFPVGYLVAPDAPVVSRAADVPFEIGALALALALD